MTIPISNDSPMLNFKSRSRSMRRAIQITLSLFIAFSAGCESDTKTGSSSDESVAGTSSGTSSTDPVTGSMNGPFASYELSDTGRALLRGPTEDALEALRLEHEPTEGEERVWLHRPALLHDS